MSVLETAIKNRVVEYPDWQREDVVGLVSRAAKHGTANWSEMGCFKTTTGLRMIRDRMQELGIENPAILIITSRSGKGTFYEWVPELMPEYTILNIETNGLDLFKDGETIRIPSLKYIPKEFSMPTVCLTHYQVFSRSNKGKFETDKNGRPIKIGNNLILKEWTQADHIANRNWDFIWCDEGHRLKDKDSRWTVQIKKIPVSNPGGKHVSTGTGFINRPDEIWSPLNWLNREKFRGYHDFKNEFCLIDDWDGYEKVVGTKPEKIAELRGIVDEYGVRRTLDEVMPHIRQPLFSAKDVELNPTQRKMYDELKAQLRTLDKNGSPIDSPNVLSLLQRCRQICVATPEVVSDEYDEKLDRRVTKIRLREPSSKLDELMDIIDELRWDDYNKEPLVVFSNFVDPLNLLKVRFDVANAKAAENDRPLPYPYIWMQQADADNVRFDKWKVKFGSGNYRIFMSTLQLGGESINLTPARHVVFLDRSWSPKDNSQGIGRIRRPGQEGQPVVININAIKTTDQRIEEVNNMKQGWFDEIFGDE